MDKIPYRIPEYHKMVWCEAWKDVVKYYLDDLRNLVGNIVVAIISGLVYALWSYVMQGIMIDWVGVVLSVVAGFVGWGILMVVGNGIWKIPAMLYRERETEAFKFTWNDIEVKPFFFPGSSFGNGVGLEVISDKNRNIFNNTSQEFSIEVTKLLIGEFNQGTEINCPKRDLYLYATDSIVFHPTTSIPNRRDAKIKGNWVKHVVVPLVRWDNNRAWIETKDGVKDLLLEGGKPYRIVVDFNEWSLNDVNVKWGCAVWCNLRYIEKDQGKMIVEIEIAKRNPEYEYRKK